MRDDLRAGLVASQIHNANLTKATRHKATKPSDFILFDPFKKSEVQNVDAAIIAAFGGKK